MASERLPEMTRITVGYGPQTYGDIRLDHNDVPHFTGNTAALEQLWLSVNRQAFYKNLTPPQILARMTQKMRGPLWAVEVIDNG